MITDMEDQQDFLQSMVDDLTFKERIANVEIEDAQKVALNVGVLLLNPLLEQFTHLIEGFCQGGSEPERYDQLLETFWTLWSGSSLYLGGPGGFTESMINGIVSSFCVSGFRSFCRITFSFFSSC